MVQHAECLSQLALGITEHLSPTPKTPEESLVDFKEGCVGLGKPFTAPEKAAADELLTALALGFTHGMAIHRFRNWLKHAPPEDLAGTTTEIRLRYFDQCPDRYIPKSTAARLLREHKAGR